MMRRGNDATEEGRDSHADDVPTHRSEKGGVRRIASDVLFAGASEVIVEHEGNDYRLRCTSKRKLILTK